MANDYYAPGTLTSHTLARAGAVQAQLDLIEDGFDKLPSEAALKQDRVTYGTTAGSANAYTLTLGHTVTLTAGLHVRAKIHAANTDASTLNVNATGAVAVKLADGTDPVSGTMPTDSIVGFTYDGSVWKLENGMSDAAAAEAAASAVAAAASEVAAEAAADLIVDWGWEGVWSGATTYAQNNVVSHEGYSYISLADANLNNTPAYNGGAGTASWGVIAAKGDSGEGTGDLLAAENLADVADAATAFSNIKQAATESATGVVELATTAEVVTGTDTARGVTPAGVQAGLNGGAITRTAAVAMADQSLSRPFIKDYAIEVVAKGNLGATPAFDYSAGNVQTGTLDQNVSSSTMTNWPATGRYGRLELIITQDASAAKTVAWPAAVTWSDGEAPDLSTLSSVHHLVFTSLDAGTTIRGFRAGGNFA